MSNTVEATPKRKRGRPSKAADPNVVKAKKGTKGTVGRPKGVPNGRRLYFPNANAHTEARIIDIIEKLSKGYSREKTVKYTMDTYKVKLEEARFYVHDAYIRLFETNKIANVDELREQYVDRIERMMEEALRNNQYTVALKCQDMLNKMYSMYVEKHEVDVKTDVIKFNFDS